MLTFTCTQIAVENGKQVCVSYVAQEQLDPSQNLLNISTAGANDLLVQIVIIFATIWVYDKINLAIKGM